jgi:hypothetical protein
VPAAVLVAHGDLREVQREGAGVHPGALQLLVQAAGTATGPASSLSSAAPAPAASFGTTVAVHWYSPSPGGCSVQPSAPSATAQPRSASSAVAVAGSKGASAWLVRQ